MISSSNIISSTFSLLPLKLNSSPSPVPSPQVLSIFSLELKHGKSFAKISYCYHKKGLRKWGGLHLCRSSFNKQISEDSSNDSSSSPFKENGILVDTDNNENGGNRDGEERDWTTSILLFTLWGGLIYYVLFLAPDQTPATDMYFLRKLLNLTGDDGFKMNEVIVALWYIMGLWPLVYSMLLLPTARSSKQNIPVWPFLLLSCFGGAYALIPYFVLWRPPAPAVEESELRRWPLNFLESKITAGIALTAGLGIIVYAVISGNGVWKEFYQYFGGSKFIHVTTIDFTLLSTFAPFWVYNDMTARKWDEKGSWILPFSIIPLLGPALYLLLRPSLTVAPISSDTDQ